MIDIDDLIHAGNFCEIITDKFIHEEVKRGHLVYVAGHKALPEDENDPYTQRIKFFCHLVDKYGHIDERFFIMDPKSLQRVDKRKQKKFEKLVKAVADAHGIN